MGFIKEINKDFFIKDNKIVLSEEYKKNSKFKKITGSRLASILGKNKYCSSLKTWAIMVGIYADDMDPMYSDAGNIIEPKIRNYVETKTKTKYLSYNPITIQFDMFKEDKIFGGIPDGEPVGATNDLLYPDKPMLEIKTTSIDSFLFFNDNGKLRVKRDENNFPIVKSIGTKKEQWFINSKLEIPIEYKYQLGLYCYLRQISSGLFAVSFLEAKDYADPNNFVPTDKNTYLKYISIDINKFQKVIISATGWFNNHIKTGVSPEINQEDWLWIKG